MRFVLTIFILIPLSVFAQSSSFNFHSLENIKKFADHLFCEGDYLRAIEQYELMGNNLFNDTIQFKIMLGFSELNLYQNSNEVVKNISTESKFFFDAFLLSMKNKLLIEPKPLSIYESHKIETEYFRRMNKLISTSMLYDKNFSLTKKNITSPFDESEKEIISKFYDLKMNPPYKSSALAGLISAVVPGSGKMYVGEWGDGITAFLVTGLLAFLAYDNFQADHTTRAWIFSGLGAFFYAGNIYGSIAAAQIFNAKVDFDFNNGLKFFLEEYNYFVPDYDFCN